MVYICNSYCLVHKQLSAKKQLKATAWHAKQKLKQKDNKDHEKSLQPCKYFQNGFCKSVSSVIYIYIYIYIYRERERELFVGVLFRKVYNCHKARNVVACGI